MASEMEGRWFPVREFRAQLQVARSQALAQNMDADDLQYFVQTFLDF
jgi:hypothetical protein